MKIDLPLKEIEQNCTGITPMQAKNRMPDCSVHQ